MSQICRKPTPGPIECLRIWEDSINSSAWGEGIGWEAGNPDGPHEANYLRLSHEKITEVFGWHPVWNVREAVQKTVEWTKAEDKKAETEREIKAFLEKADY